ncbi:hypothetical protein WJX81_000856 [Elliptochloris bilobata]|uniref:RRM domain-containing protein n=1 Tax=Elliptochloris bilobata TaxID=381761 RepID=A0AAW1S7V8_9CHLO
MVAASLNACVQNLPRKWDQQRLVALLQEQGLQYVVARKKAGRPYAFVSFACAEHRAAAEAALRTLTLAGRPMAVRDATVGRDKGAAAQLVEPTEATRAVAEMDIRNAVTPLWQVPYGEQLRRKHAVVAAALARITKLSAKAHRAALRPGTWPAWLHTARGAPGNAAAPLVGIVRSPQLQGYRNKCEFTVGVGTDDKPAVGFLLGAYKDGLTAVVPPTGCRNVSAVAAECAALLQAFVRQRSRLPVWDKRCNSGFWRLLLVREGRRRMHLPDSVSGQPLAAAAAGPVTDLDWQRWLITVPEAPGAALEVSEAQAAPPPPDELMLIVQVDPTAPGADALAQGELAALGEFLRQSAPRPLTTLLLQHHSGLSNAAAPDALLLPFPAPPADGGERQCICDALGDLTFRISPSAFFQVNTGAAAVLYALAGAWAAPDPGAVLLDICCGTGTIGLTLARRAARVVGVDIVESAVADARTALVAVVDPPRAGLHPRVLHSLLQCAALRRLVYVSCNPDTLARDAAALCAPQGRGGPLPFAPVRAAAVDLFPHTAHVEAVLLLER